MIRANKNKYKLIQILLQVLQQLKKIFKFIFLSNCMNI